MTINIGTADRIARIVIGLALILAPFVTGWSLFASPFWVWVSVIAGLVLMATAAVRRCPIYRVINLSTARDADR